MKLSRPQISLVQDSIHAILPIAQQTGEQFYARLFEIAPSLRALFPADISSQSRKLMTILIHIVANLDQMEGLEKELADLARRHINYQVEMDHYKWIGEALFWTLEQKIGDGWTPELEVAWKVAYQQIADAMIKVHEEHS